MRLTVPLFLFISLFISCSEKPNTYPWLKGSYLEAPKDGKITLIDFWSEGCGPCRRMNKHTFTDETIIQYSKENFHSYKYDAWIEINKDVTKKFVKNGVPLIVFLDEEGNEIERITEFMWPEEYLGELQRIVQGDGTFAKVKASYEKDTENLEFLYEYACKLEQKEGTLNPEVTSLFTNCTEKAEPGSYIYDFALFRLSIGHLWNNKNPNLLKAHIDTIAYRDFTIEGQEKVAKFYRKNNKIDELVGFYLNTLPKVYEFIENEKDYRYLSILNETAWYLYEYDREIDIALKAIEYALELSIPVGKEKEDVADYNDTYAYLLLTKSRYDEALVAINNSIKLMPDKKEFQKTKNLILAKM